MNAKDFLTPPNSWRIMDFSGNEDVLDLYNPEHPLSFINVQHELNKRSENNGEDFMKEEKEARNLIIDTEEFETYDELSKHLQLKERKYAGLSELRMFIPPELIWKEFSSGDGENYLLIKGPRGVIHEFSEDALNANDKEITYARYTFKKDKLP